MSDDDRLADYVRRLEDDRHRRKVTDGCGGCGRSLVACHADQYLNATKCCPTCSHERRPR